VAHIPKEQFPIFKFKEDLWHPKHSKKYIDSENFIIVNHDKQGVNTYVELLQSGSSELGSLMSQIEGLVGNSGGEIDKEGLTCNCKFRKSAQGGMVGS